MQTYKETLYSLRWTVVTVSSVVGLAYVMNLSGQIITLGMWAAGVGSAFAPISPLIGWLGSAVTGSDTSSNALFGMLQVTTARHAGLPEILLAAANTSGGVVGKAISPQNLSIAAVAVGLTGREGYLFRQVFAWTVLLIAILSLLVFLQSTVVLSWMIPA
jgi:lactate permease